MTPQHPHLTPPPAADTVAPVAAPRTYRERVEAIRTGGTLAGQKVRLRCIEIAAEADAALDATRALVEAALALDAYRVEADAAGWPDWDARFDALASAAAAYRAWAPSPDAARDGGD